jgi:chemotaxis protein methyltransferase CheR
MGAARQVDCKLMSDTECVAFLKWALPQLQLRWAGFRTVHGQVCKRLRRRMASLGTEEFAAYREKLASDPREWLAVDQSCHITISRFFRDRGVFHILQSRVLPEIAERARSEQREARCWSIGCASGEEPYTVKILWDLLVERTFPGVILSVTATDVDEAVLARAREGCFNATSLRDLPATLVSQAFERVEGRFCLLPRHRKNIRFMRQDIRAEAPAGKFDLVLCRNIAFTYFSEPVQRQVLTRIMDRLRSQGFLVIGAHERLPAEHGELVPLARTSGCFKRRRSGCGALGST